MIENGKKVLMSDLKIGDKVQTGISFILHINVEKYVITNTFQFHKQQI